MIPSKKNKKSNQDAEGQIKPTDRQMDTAKWNNWARKYSVQAAGPVKTYYGRKDVPGKTQHKAGFNTSPDAYAKAGTNIPTLIPGGKVLKTGSGDRQGNYATIDYGHGVTADITHMQNIGVKPGQTLGAGESVGTVGDTGYSPSGPHSSMKIKVNGVEVDPQTAFPGYYFDPKVWGGNEKNLTNAPFVGPGGKLGAKVDTSGIPVAPSAPIAPRADKSTYADPKAVNPVNAVKPVSVDSTGGRSATFTNASSSGSSSGGGFGQQVNLSVLGQVPMRKSVNSSSPLSTTSFAQPTVPLTNKPLGSPNSV